MFACLYTPSDIVSVKSTMNGVIQEVIHVTRQTGPWTIWQHVDMMYVDIMDSTRPV